MEKRKEYSVSLNSTELVMISEVLGLMDEDSMNKLKFKVSDNEWKAIQTAYAKIEKTRDLK